MTILEFALLRGRCFTPAELGLPDSVLAHAGDQPLHLELTVDPPLYTSTGAWNKQNSTNNNSRRRYHRERANAGKRAAGAAEARPAKQS